MITIIITIQHDWENQTSTMKMSSDGNEIKFELSGDTHEERMNSAKAMVDTIDECADVNISYGEHWKEGHVGRYSLYRVIGDNGKSSLKVVDNHEK